MPARELPREPAAFALQCPASMDPRTFESLLDEHYAALYRFAYSLAKNPDDAADLTQQAFAVFARKGDEVRDPSKCKSWLFTTLYREFLKQAGRARRVVSLDDDQDAPRELSAPPTEASRSLDQHAALTALASLEESQRAVLALFYLDQCSYREIAEILEIPIGTVMSRLSRGKEALREKMRVGEIPGE